MRTHAKKVAIISRPGGVNQQDPVSVPEAGLLVEVGGKVRGPLEERPIGVGFPFPAIEVEERVEALLGLRDAPVLEPVGDRVHLIWLRAVPRRHREK